MYHLAPGNRVVLRTTLGAAGLLVLMGGLVGGATGCGSSDRLETGYRYRVLGSSEEERRAFYADKYSVEARRAEQSGGGAAERHRSTIRPQ